MNSFICSPLKSPLRGLMLAVVCFINFKRQNIPFRRYYLRLHKSTLFQWAINKITLITFKPGTVFSFARGVRHGRTPEKHKMCHLENLIKLGSEPWPTSRQLSCATNEFECLARGQMEQTTMLKRCFIFSILLVRGERCDEKSEAHRVDFKAEKNVLVKLNSWLNASWEL